MEEEEREGLLHIFKAELFDNANIEVCIRPSYSTVCLTGFACDLGCFI